MKVLAIGDIHTKQWMIYEAAERINKYDAIVFVGDYADDWNASAIKSLETWEMLKKFQENYPDKVKLVTGNHDYIYAHKTPTSQSGYNQVTQLLLNSHENKALKLWLENLPITLELDGVTYSHAGVTVFYVEGHELWDNDSPLWARPGGEQYESYPQVFGHTPSQTCWEVQPNVWCIDTFSTYPDGRLIGDQTMLSITDGKTFEKVKTETKNGNNNNPPSL